MLIVRPLSARRFAATSAARSPRTDQLQRLDVQRGHLPDVRPPPRVEPPLDHRQVHLAPLTFSSALTEPGTSTTLQLEAGHRLAP